MVQSHIPEEPGTVEGTLAAGGIIVDALDYERTNKECCLKHNTELLARARPPSELIKTQLGKVSGNRITYDGGSTYGLFTIDTPGAPSKEVHIPFSPPFDNGDKVRIHYLAGEQVPLEHWKQVVYLPHDKTETAYFIAGSAQTRSIWVPKELEIIEHPLVIEKITSDTHRILLTILNREAIKASNLEIVATQWMG